MHRNRVLTIDGEDFELEPSSARKLIERLVVLSHENTSAPSCCAVLEQLLSTDQLTACERHLMRSIGALRAGYDPGRNEH